MLGGLTMCEVSVDDGEQRSEQNEGDRNRCDDRNNKAENWVQNEMTDGHKKLEQRMGHRLVFKLDSEQADGWSQHVEQKLARRLGAKQIDESQHRVSWASRGSQIGQKMRTNHVWNRHGSVHSGASKASSNTRVQMSLGRGSQSTVLDGWQVCLRGTRVDACLCPKIQKANS